MANLLEFFEYFQGLTEDRRASPREDLASVVANAEVDGEPIGVLEAVGYYVIIATAGHDTTSAAISGGSRPCSRPGSTSLPAGRPCAGAVRGGGDGSLWTMSCCVLKFGGGHFWFRLPPDRIREV